MMSFIPVSQALVVEMIEESDLGHPRQGPFWVPIEKIIREGRDLFETLHRTKEGTIRPVEVHCPYWSSNGGC